MVAICLQCGDKGFSNALVYCVKCLEVAVHRYCLDELPDTFDEFVHWVCDDCEAEVPQQVTSLNNKPIQLGSKYCANPEHVRPSSKKMLKRRRTCNVVVESAKGLSVVVPPKQSSEIELTKSVQSVGEFSPLEMKQKASDAAASITKTTDQIALRSSPPQLDDSDNEVGSQHSESANDDVPLKRIKTKKKGKKKNEGVRKFSEEELMQRPEYIPYERPCEAYIEDNVNDHNDSTEFEKAESSLSEAESNKKNRGSTRNWPLLGNLVKINGYSPSERIFDLYDGNNLDEYIQSTALEHKELDVTDKEVPAYTPLNKLGDRRRVVYPLSVDLPEQGPKTQPETPGFVPHPSENVTLHNDELAQPLADPIWRGSFNILNAQYDIFEGMVAHLSRKACQKAYEETSLFPTLLHLEMHHKLDVWPPSFEKSEPSDDNIALYFFPMHKRYERMFDHLVEEMVGHELAMRAILENAELLVFTSTELPLNFWRFQGKYYLWGVFRAKQSPSANHDLGSGA